ncbi:DHA2 family efflux MFS transporter permease subunit [Solihabitans fulvus]|uniref:DHA2 family efflux MFS transporter permease subunit n=1 Tax=Solihabitans fulvus TaxID=1892852 RepID=A0A5B2WJZ3_9PSEU|nr:DHA2 family efflux MFS transporter permease subunit [Solihabitans fulvus]KAA2251238.1 DHA2 family efflux MFS transporter permease subunit [Solihabitans fulvus]
MNRQTTNPWAALSALCIGFFMIMLDTTIVNVAIPSMLSGLHAGLNDIVWVNSIYLLTYAVPLLLTGRLGDRFGPKRMFMAGLVIFTGASLWCGLAGSVELLIAARAVQGLGAAAMTPQTMAFITRLFKPSERGAPMGMWGAVAGVATIAGPLLGGLLVDNLGWEWIFFVNVPIGVIGLIMTIFLVPDWQPKHSHSFDLLGILLCCLGLTALVFGVQNGQHYDWGTVTGSITITEIIVAGVVLLIAFVVWQAMNKREPLMQLALFRIRNFSFANLANVTIGFTLTGMFLPLVIYIQSVLGYTPLASGVVTAPMSLVSGVVAPFAGKFSDRISGKYLVMFGFLSLAAGVALLSLQAQPTSNPWSFTPALMLCGLGIGCIFSPLANLAMSDVQPQLMGGASGIFNTSRQIGGVLGSAAIGVLLQARLTVSMPAAASDAAQALPENLRKPFVDGFTNSAASAGEFGPSGGPQLPPGVPQQVAEQLRHTATTAFHQGFTDAAKVTLLMPAVVLVLGAVACIGMRGRSKQSDAAPSPRPTVVEPVSH